MKDLYAVIGKNDDLEQITPQAHSAMVNILEYLSRELVEHTHRRITTLFRYELGKLKQYEVCSPENPETLVKQNGHFTRWVNSIFDFLVGRLNSDSLKRQLDMLQDQSLAPATFWINLIEEIEHVKSGKDVWSL